MINYDNPEVEEQWCLEQNAHALAYFDSIGLKRGEFSEWPAAFIAPIFAIWAVESGSAPGKIGWWVITGDLPTDYISGTGAPDPRVAVSKFAEKWSGWVEAVECGAPPTDYTIGEPSEAPDLAALLKTRAQFLKKLDDEEAFWEEVFG